MKAVRIHEFGGPEVLRVEDLPRPEPAAGEVLVQVRAASINPVDYKIRNGKYPAVKADQLPVVLGRDIAGVVAALGAQVAGLAAGDEVFAMLPQDRGGYAEWVAVPAGLCAPKPRTLDMLQAASVPLAALTAWQGLFDQGGLKRGQKVLIHGASGGVGHFAVQLAHSAGAEVYATASTEHQAFLKELGVDHPIDYQTERFEAVARGLDLVYDLIGGETQDRSWGVLKRGGVLICTVQQPDQETAARFGVRAGRYTCQPDGRELARIGELIDAGEVKVRIDQVFPLERAADAERHLEHDTVAGKVVLSVQA